MSKQTPVHAHKGTRPSAHGRVSADARADNRQPREAPGPRAVLALQQSVGNQVVQRLIAQRAPTIGAQRGPREESGAKPSERSAPDAGRATVEAVRASEGNVIEAVQVEASDIRDYTALQFNHLHDQMRLTVR